MDCSRDESAVCNHSDLFAHEQIDKNSLKNNTRLFCFVYFVSFLCFLRRVPFSQIQYPQGCLVVSWSVTVVCDSFQPHGLQPTRLLCPWGFPGKNIEVGNHFLFQRVFPDQGSNPQLRPQQADSYHRATREAHLQEHHFNL